MGDSVVVMISSRSNHRVLVAAAAAVAISAVLQVTVVLGDDDVTVPAQYAYQWQVLDKEFNNDFGQEETRSGDKVQGSYYILLPDGRRQKVSYTVDGQSGFQADLEFVGDIIETAASSVQPVRKRIGKVRRPQLQQLKRRPKVKKGRQPNNRYQAAAAAKPVVSVQPLPPAATPAYTAPSTTAAPATTTTTIATTTAAPTTTATTTTTTAAPSTSSSYQSLIEPLPVGLSNYGATASNTPAPPVVASTLPPPGKIY